MRESSLEAYFRLRIRKLGGMSEKIAPTRWGLPDRLVLLPGGRLYLVELKTDVGQLRDAQTIWHRRAAELGTTVIVLRGKEEVDAWIVKVRGEIWEDQDRPRQLKKPAANTDLSDALQAVDLAI